MLDFVSISYYDKNVNRQRCLFYKNTITFQSMTIIIKYRNKICRTSFVLLRSITKMKCRKSREAGNGYVGYEQTGIIRKRQKSVTDSG